jgi:hypothetical protein
MLRNAGKFPEKFDSFLLLLKKLISCRLIFYFSLYYVASCFLVRQNFTPPNPYSNALHLLEFVGGLGVHHASPRVRHERGLDVSEPVGVLLVPLHGHREAFVKGNQFLPAQRR